MKMRIAVALLGLLYVMPTVAYDTALVERFAQFYEPFEGKTCAKSLQMIKPADFVKALKEDKKPFALDVRTEQESAIYGITLADSLSMPMSQVFTKETLDKLPTDRKIVVICKGGHRATAVAMGLRQIGFRDVYILKGGFTALANYLTPMTAN